MRRGHPGMGNWRGENPRHFRPRGGGTPHFRPSMPFGPIESNRFHSPGQRYRGPRPYNSHQMHGDDMGQSDHDRPYRGPGHSKNQSRVPERHDNRERHPVLMNVQKNNHGGSYNKSNYYEGHNYSTNNMGDVDRRARSIDHRPRDVDHRQNFGPGLISPWINPPFERRSYQNEKSPHKTPKHPNTGDGLLPIPDYSGHRPPSSDHYSDTSGPNNNNNPYSRSVDDTVDIVRKRLMNRDCQDNSDPTSDHREIDTDMRKNIDQSLHETPQEQPVKKRIQRQRSNCDKMKNKIVHQLFKMDKGKIHKLMDNPNSSSKFEYAISSLITESQNSFNRHMRSVAEKSLNTPSSSSDFIHDDNNTIYEDTFMRQMQGILDPQDTILLEDIKPLVLAELSKVLRLDDFDRYEGSDEHARYTQEDYNYQFNEYPNNVFCEQEINHENVFTRDICDDFNQPLPEERPSPLFERRPVKREVPIERSRSRSTESWQPSKSSDSLSHNRSIEVQKEKEKEEPRPLFDGNCDQLSEDEDPFAELDNQYHVAVDHNFIEREDDELVSPIPGRSNNLSPVSPSYSNKTANVPVFDTPLNNVIKEIDIQLQSVAKSPLGILVSQSIDKENAKLKTMKIKQEIQENVAAIKMSIDQSITEKVKVKQESTPEKVPDSEPIKTSNSHGKHISRKRSVDTKPSHRKEKRKKSSHSECQEAASSILNMLYEKPPEKDTKSVDSKGYSDKNVKKKELHNKPKEKEPETPKQDTSKKLNTSHSSTTPKDTSNSSVGDQTPTKVDKVKLTAIDIFSAGPKPKKGNVHQAHRNTSTSTPLAVVKNPDENKIKPIVPTVTSFARKLSRRHMGTQVIRKLRNKECQTLEHKKNTTGTQTDPVKFDKNQRLSEDPLERMKEIDMEIQMLLQEKFKLYNSMETRSKDSIGSSSSMGTLGMAVLNVPIETDENEKDDNEDALADSIAEDFTNLPVEDLEQIAMETMQENKSASPVDKRSHSRKKLLAKLSRNKSESPTSRKRKTQTPNISLLEQIISDDRPIEEIISLDALESTPVRSKKKPTPRSTRKKPNRRQTKPTFNPQTYDLKNCSVVLNRLDVTRYLQARADELKTKINLKPININNHETEVTENTAETRPLSPIFEEKPVPQPIEEPVNDIQIDMMEVCEDIVIGDEVKTISDVEERVPVNEEIILDNSQSSVEYPAPEITEGECKMYDYSTDDILKRDSVTVTGNADAVLAIECVDNSFIAACLDGNVYHYTTDGQLVNTLRGSNLAVTCLTIVKEKHGTTVYTGSLDSRIRYYDLDTGLEKGPECNVLSPIQTMDRAWDTVFVGTRTGFVLQFECKNNMLIPVSTVKFSEQSILALRAMKEGPRKVLLVAARSDNVTIKDAQTGLLLRTLEGPKMTVYSLLFEDGKVYCGTSSHQIHVFDYASGSHVLAHSGGKGAVCLRAEGGLVFAGCYDGCVYVFREAEPRPLAQLRGPHLMLLSLAIHGTKIIAGYKDRSLYIWKIPLGVLQEMIL